MQDEFGGKFKTRSLETEGCGTRRSIEKHGCPRGKNIASDQEESMVVVAIVSSQIRKEFLRNWGLSSVLYLIGLTVTRGTVSELQIMVASAVLGFAQIFGGTLIQCSNQFHYFTALCGYPYVQVVFEHFFGNLQNMDWNPGSSVTATHTKAWWGTAGWKSPKE